MLSSLLSRRDRCGRLVLARPSLVVLLLNSSLVRSRLTSPDFSSSAAASTPHLPSSRLLPLPPLLVFPLTLLPLPPPLPSLARAENRLSSSFLLLTALLLPLRLFSSLLSRLNRPPTSPTSQPPPPTSTPKLPTLLSSYHSSSLPPCLLPSLRW